MAAVEAHAAEFRRASELIPDPASGGFAPATLWFRLVPRSADAQRWYLDVDMNVDSGEVVYRAPNGRVERSAFGMRIPYADRPNASYRVLAAIPAEAPRHVPPYLLPTSPLPPSRPFSTPPD